MGAPISLKQATSASFGGKKTLEIYIFRLPFQNKTEWVQPSLSAKFGIIMSGLDTYFLEVSAHALLKVGTKNCFIGKKSEHLGFFWLFFWSKNGGVWLE